MFHTRTCVFQTRKLFTLAGVQLAGAVRVPANRETALPNRSNLLPLHSPKVFNLLGEFEFLPNREAVSFLFGQICRTTPLACASIITAVAGLNTGGREVAGWLA